MTEKLRQTTYIVKTSKNNLEFRLPETGQAKKQDKLTDNNCDWYKKLKPSNIPYQNRGSHSARTADKY